jgi:hypothetical protein
MPPEESGGFFSFRGSWGATGRVVVGELPEDWPGIRAKKSAPGIPEAATMLFSLNLV